MAEFVAVGPARNLDGPLPVAPEYRLLSVPGVLEAGDSEWLNGVNIWGYPCDTPSLWEPCSEGTFRTKADDSTSPQPRFDSFVAYLPISCSTISGDPQEFARRAEAVLDATLSFAVEEALSQGVVGSSNPFFGDTNLTQLGGGTLTAQVGINYLENAIGATGRGGMIHATPGTISAWNFSNLLTEGEVLRTANGTPVVSGGGVHQHRPHRANRIKSLGGSGMGLRNWPRECLPGEFPDSGSRGVRGSREQHHHLPSREVRARNVGHLFAIRCANRLDTVMSPKEGRGWQ